MYCKEVVTGKWLRSLLDGERTVNNKELTPAGVYPFVNPSGEDEAMKRHKKIQRISHHWGRVKQSLLILVVSVFVGAASLPSQAEGATLDSESTRCMSCHNESAPFDTADHHPIGVVYSKAASLDPAILLINDRIGCGTCHVPYSEANHQTLSNERSAFPSVPDPLLVMDNRRSELCLECHVK